MGEINAGSGPPSDGHMRITGSVLDRIRPDEEEMKRIETIMETVITRSRELQPEMGVEFGMEHVGSTAKGTNLRNGDIDIFYTFDPSVNRGVLKDFILSIGERILPEVEIRYAEHPYVRGRMDGHEIDLVPCYAVEAEDRIQSAVDRTPFHTKYIRSELREEQKDDVRLLKRFMKGIGCYGAENRIMGFSGYLCELIILRYGDLWNALAAVSSWKENTVIDIKDTGYLGPGDQGSLVVVDPVDPTRNVASPVSPRNLGLLIHASRAFLDSPTIQFFYPEERRPFTREKLREMLNERGEMMTVSFGCPEVMDDILHPQLRMTVNRIGTLLEKHGFLLNDSGFFVDGNTIPGGSRDMLGTIFLFFESAVRERPPTALHQGPKVYNREHGDRFVMKWKDRNPFIRGDRWYVFAPVQYRRPKELLQAELPVLSTGRHIRDAMDLGFEVMAPEEVPEKALTDFLDKRMPWER